MNKSELLRRLSSALAGEESTDLHTEEDREAAINDAYNEISEMYMLAEADLALGPLPADFISYSLTIGKYNRLPPPLVDQTSEPWGGKYAVIHPAIVQLAAFKLYSNRGPEVWDKAEYWMKVYQNSAASIQRTLQRHNAAMYATGDATETYQGMINKLSFNLDTSEMTYEQAYRMFPANVRIAAINDAYIEITSQLALGVKEFSGIIPTTSNGETELLDILPDDFMATYTSPFWFVDANGRRQTVAPGRNDVGTWGYVFDSGKHKLSALNKGAPVTINGRYLPKPPPLVNQTDKPWGGRYPSIASALIVELATRDLLRGKKETYNLSRFWQNEFDRDVKTFKRLTMMDNHGATASRAAFGYIGTEPLGGSAYWPDVNQADKEQS